MKPTKLETQSKNDENLPQPPVQMKKRASKTVTKTDYRNTAQTHEEKVEKFFSHGAETRAIQEDGFLSFGYWTIRGQNYHQAAESLLELLLSNERPLGRGTVLDVACGYGTETFRIYNKLKPDKIVGIDITSAHIKYAKKMAIEQDVAEKISFKKQDACILPFKSETFTHVIGIEGPSQFNTREKFLKRAYDVLEPDGVLLLADVIIHKNTARKGWLNRKIGRILSKQWYIPEPNWMNFEKYRKMLVGIGFKVDLMKGIGANVYTGFARFNTKWSSIKNAIAVRGLGTGIGLTIISWLLGIAFKRGMLDYAYIRAVKK